MAENHIPHPEAVSKDVAQLVPRALPPGWQLIVHQRVGSTSDEAKRLARDGAGAGTVVWAGEQTGGRGRAGRGWASPPGNLYVSVVLRPAVAQARLAELGLVAVVALSDVVATLLSPGRLEHKWPNDLLVDDRKVAGILVETESGGGWVVIGTGVNLVSHPDLPGIGATDLHEAGAATTPQRMLSALMQALDARVRAWEGDGFVAIRAAWMKRARPGRPLTVRLPDRELAGAFDDLDLQGRLVLRLPDATTKLIAAGEIFFVGSASV